MSADLETTRTVRAWLRQETDASAGPLLAAVLGQLDETPQLGRLESARAAAGRTSIALLGAAVAAVVVVAIVGLSLLQSASGPGGPTATPTPQATDTVTPPPLADPPRLAEAIGIGFVGLPPAGALPSTPATGVVVDSVLLNPYALPYLGTAWLFGDGRLIWYRFYDGPAGHNSHSTGLLEQRLTAEGVRLYQDRGSLYDKNPLFLPDWLPASGWADQTIRPYVSASYAICMEAFDPNAPLPDRIYPRDGPPMDLSAMLALLPRDAADLLQAREDLPPADDAQHCLAMPTDEARLLDGALARGELERDAQQDAWVLVYFVDTGDPAQPVLSIRFEPRLPDGSYFCSSCG